MNTKEKYSRHYEENILIPASPEEVFIYADDHTNFSSHMNKSSWMMGGGKMTTHPDDRNFQKVGSHLRMSGTVFGIKLFLDEVITHHQPPYRKEWQTVGDLDIIVIGHYKLGFEIKPENSNSKLKVYIDYNLPNSFKTRLLGILFGRFYAKWCVNQMISGVGKHFKSE
ncbi:MAG: hypothetical protein A3D74_05620 [Candidatus Levybacteria bacterium RIFCSPHIGHO2_02_FULL_37_13]|nr:MAG: hypothetical protein A3D74_05620 [Candidatus Levybacteria bacterium RIFCSPHIGHO2_02_FULL_37_13]OGH29111.1 MAG: hypothetical protein A3E40_03115 [Candidatus Levybacteria bacterium RIFCSPHIGHO2_12_FULL_37_9]